MRSSLRLGLAAAAVLALSAAFTSSSFAATNDNRAPGHAVFVLTDNTAGNQVVAYDRHDDGSLTQAGVYGTGGKGGVLAGSVVDHTASQGALAYDAAHSVLYAVNPGSSSVSVFRVLGDRLVLTQVVPSGGPFPVSIAVHGGLVYVLNALGGGSVQGYLALGGFLLPLPGSSRPLGLNPLATPQFTTTPGQVAFSPDGSKLIVTTKANTNAIEVFQVGRLGYLSTNPVVNVEPGAVPFAVSFDRSGNLVVAEAGPNALATFEFGLGGTLTPLDTVATAQVATCWIAAAGPYFYASNAGSGSLSDFGSGGGGTLSLLGTTSTDGGTVDAAATPDGSFLYVQAGALGKVDAFRVDADGSLTAVGSVVVPGAVGGEGIVAG